MAASRRQGSRPSPLGALLGALVRLVLLVAVGFGVGLMIGLVSEEPALMYGYLAGEGETVPLLDSAAETEPIITAPLASLNEPGTGAPSNAGRLEQRRATAQEADAQAKRLALQRDAEASAALPRVAAPAAVEASLRRKEASDRVTAVKPVVVAPNADQWAIQVGAFSEEATARLLVRSLETKGYPVTVLPSDRSNARWRVRVQPLREQSAREIASQLKREEGLPTWLIPLEAGSR